MTATIRPLAEISHQARQVLVRELGVVDTLRFLGQLRAGSGDYTAERAQWLDDLSLDEIVADIGPKRRKPRRSGS